MTPAPNEPAPTAPGPTASVPTAPGLTAPDPTAPDRASEAQPAVARGSFGRGSIAGLLATVAMSAVFVAGDQSGMIDTPPPRKIIDRFLPLLPAAPSDCVALVTHLGYGTLGGVAYEALIGRGDPKLARRVAGGVVYGLAVWAVSYEGWVPAMGVLPMAHRDDAKRASTVLAAHLVYGAGLGAVGWYISRRAGRRARREAAGEAERRIGVNPSV